MLQQIEASPTEQSNFYKENAITLSLSTRNCFVFVLQNWAYAVFIYSIAYIFSFKKFVNNLGQNLSDFELVNYFILNLLVINVVRVFTTLTILAKDQTQLS